MLKRTTKLLAPDGPAAAPPPTTTAPAAAPGAAATPPAAEPPKPPAAKPIDSKQLAGFAADFLGKQFTGSKEEGAPGDPLVAGNAPKPGTAAAAPNPPAKPKKVPAKPAAPRVEPKADPPPTLTAEQIAEAAARGVAGVMKPVPSGPGAAPKTELSPSEERKFSVLQQMEKMYPEKYTGLADQYKSSLLELQKYAAKWEEEHPGETFDETDQQHEGFFAKHDVDWEDEDYTEAVADIRATARLAEQQKQSEQRMSKLERGERLRQAAPEIGNHQTAGAVVFWGNTIPELSKVVAEDGTVNAALLAEHQKKDPIGYSIRVNAANQLNREVAELYKVMNGLEPFDERNSAHLAIGQFASDMERDLMRRPDEQQRDQLGRKFLPAKEYWKLPKERRDEYYWTFSPAELSALRGHSLAGQTEKWIAAEHKKHQEYAIAMGWTPPAGGETGAAPTSAPSGEQLERDDGKPQGPGSAGGSRLHATASAAASKSEDFLSSFGKRQMGQS